MSENYNIFIFRRDLRLKDNLGLNWSMKNLKNIILIFIFTPEQVIKNDYKSENAIEFMIESLEDINKKLGKSNLKLYLFQGNNIQILENIIKKITIENIVFNSDYTPYAIQRDKKIKLFCEKNKINCITKEDYLLTDIGTILKSDNKPYTIFTPFKNMGLKKEIKKPKKLKLNNIVLCDKLKDVGFINYNKNPNKLVKGGRKNGLNVLNNIKKLDLYDKERNNLEFQTTHLSAYIKFGCISIREVYYKVIEEFSKESKLIDQLFWREFYFYIVYYFPDVLKGKNFNPKYNNIKWKTNSNYFEKWKKGETGFPVVDAGMRELNKTGYMHNRCRLITSNFLNRLLGLDWRLGEKYFANKLTDYDPSVNNGNWQWIASVGTDPKPYFQRLFNPILQSQKFDKDCKYIKKWIPELKNINNKHIHNWNQFYQNYDLNEIKYVQPIINYKDARQESINTYKDI